MKQFTSDYQPKKRGKAKRTLIVEALERAGKSEEGFYDILVEKAIGDDSTAFTELWKRFHPVEKATAPTIEFDLPKDSTPLDKANAVMHGVAAGIIPPDIGSLLIQAAKHTIDIEIGTELKDRIEALEKMADAAS